MATWRELIDFEMKAHGDSWDRVVKTTLTSQQLDEVFSNGYGSSEGRPFTLWTAHRVYFPVVYDGAEWAGSARRDPCDEATQHQGGQ